jgi:beta-lactamase regulating signal transducer with metallopeptidase domain
MNLIDRAKNILLTPKTEWQVIKSETTTVSTMLTSYVLPLSLIPAIIALIAGLRLSFTYGLIMAVIAIIGAVIGFYVGTYVADALAPSFSSEKNLNRSAQLIGYSYTASAVASILGIVPVLGILAALAGFGYMVYLLYLGTQPLKSTPEDKRIGYTIVIILVQIVLYFILSAVFASLFLRSYMPY